VKCQEPLEVNFNFIIQLMLNIYKYQTLTRAGSKQLKLVSLKCKTNYQYLNQYFKDSTCVELNCDNYWDAITQIN
jgi:hypothetical protein